MALFIFFRFPALLFFSVATAMQKKNALGTKKILNPADIRLQSL